MLIVPCYIYNMKKSIEKISLDGYKLTRVREDLLSFLEEQEKPMSAQRIAEFLPGFDLASIYRNLNLFVELEIVNVEQMGGEKVYCLSSQPHHHIVCENCGHIEAIVCDHKFRHKNFSNIKHQLSLSGVCNKCRKNTK